MVISTRYKFIYVHIPKTAGNSIQEQLLPLSEDRKVAGGFRDGIDRYEVKGEVTPTKHASLADYERAGVDLADYRVIAGIRHPVARAVSCYFSPHRWFARQSDGHWAKAEPFWAIDDFVAFLKNFPTMASYLRTSGGLHQADHLIRFERLLDDYQNTVQELALPVSMTLPLRNRTSASPELTRAALEDPNVWEAVWESHGIDFETFGYPHTS